MKNTNIIKQLQASRPIEEPKTNGFRCQAFSINLVNLYNMPKPEGPEEEVARKEPVEMGRMNQCSNGANFWGNQ